MREAIKPEKSEIDRCFDGSVDGWIDRRIDASMDRWMHFLLLLGPCLPHVKVQDGTLGPNEEMPKKKTQKKGSRKVLFWASWGGTFLHTSWAFFTLFGNGAQTGADTKNKPKK